MRGWGVLVVALLAGCSSAASQLPRAADTGPTVNDGWYPGERIVAGKKLVGSYTTGPSREGTTPSGYTYRIHSDGSAGVQPPGRGMVSSWSIDCTRDQMTDRRECSISSHDARVLVSYGTGRSPRSVCIIGHDFPGRTGAIRVDDKQAIPTDKNGCVSGSTATSMAQGSRLRLRYVEWPYDYPRDHEGSLAGFAEALELVGFIQTSFDRLTF